MEDVYLPLSNFFFHSLLWLQSNSIFFDIYTFPNSNVFPFHFSISCSRIWGAANSFTGTSLGHDIIPSCHKVKVCVLYTAPAWRACAVFGFMAGATVTHVHPPLQTQHIRPQSLGDLSLLMWHFSFRWDGWTQWAEFHCPGSLPGLTWEWQGLVFGQLWCLWGCGTDLWGYPHLINSLLWKQQTPNQHCAVNSRSEMN